jgi:hypothetical protein
LFRRPLSALLTLLSLALAAAAPAQEGGRVPVRVVAGRLLVECDLSTPVRRIPVNLFLDLDTPCGLQLHNRAADPLGAESRDGQPQPIRIHFPDFSFTVPKREHGDEDLLDDFTKYHSHEMGENAVVGTIGAEVLRDWHLVFDLARGFVEFSAPRPVEGSRPDAADGSAVLEVTLRNDLVWLPVRHAGRGARAMALGGSRYDSLVDLRLAEQLGRPAGDVGAVEAGGFDLGAFVAFRPEDVVLSHPDGVFGTFGLNLFQHFRVEVDRVNRWVRLTPTAPPDFPADDLAFFRARAEDDPVALEAFLEAHPAARLAGEAAGLLLDGRLDEGATDEEVARALAWADRTTPEDLRATAALDRMKALSDDGWPAHVVAAGELGLKSGREDRYPDAVHKIHARLGEVHLTAGRGEQAWRHLLSAAFGMPEDGMVNLALGRHYENEGRWRRAFSRYVQAAIAAESGPQAIEGLQRVQPHLEDGEPFSVDLVERMIEGKVLNFGAAAAYQPDPEKPSNRVVLVELFTNAHFERFAQAGALANEGLISHFRDGHAAFLSYHLAEPGLEPLVNDYALEVARLRNVAQPGVHVFYGERMGPGAGRLRDREAIYRQLRSIAAQGLSQPSDWDLSVDYTVEDGVVRGAVTVEGPAQGADSLRLCVVLAERGVLFPGKSDVVIHRNVARAPLTATARGERLAIEDGKMVFPFEYELAGFQRQQEAWLREQVAAGKGQTVMLSTAIDPRQVSVVAYLRHGWSGEVVQAVQLHAPEEAPE